MGWATTSGYQPSLPKKGSRGRLSDWRRYATRITPAIRREYARDFHKARVLFKDANYIHPTRAFCITWGSF